jgi:hypothetical protein
MRNDPDHDRSRILCRCALAFVLTATTITAVGLLLTVDKRTVVRITQPVEAGEYLTGDRIEALTQHLSADSAYVTPDQATVGLIASRTLQPGDLLTVSDVYTTSPTPSTRHPRESWTSLRWLIFGTMMGLLAANLAAPIDRQPRRRRQRSDTQPPAAAGSSNTASMEHTAESADKASYEPAERTRGDGAVEAAGAQGWPNRELAEPVAEHSEYVAQVLTRTRDLGGVPGEQGDAIIDQALTPVAAAAGIESSLDAALSVTRSAEPVRRFTLRVFGEVAADGASTQALAVPLVIAFAGRAMAAAELAEITGYSPRTFSTVFTTDHALVRRVDGRLTLRDGVWTDHGWIAECVRQAGAVSTGNSAKERWLRQAIDEASKITGAPFGSPPAHRMKRDPYGWVDDFPVDVSARVQAGQELVEAVLAAVELWMVSDVADVVPASQLVGVCCRLAELVPYAPVADQVRPSTWRSAGECLLVAGYRIGSGDRELLQAVQSQAKRLVATGVIEASDLFADELGL